ncbi:MAG: ABC transporter permease [Actinomycetota bacterium]|nr:ABC transporter permease [Actinomycetota bacterium]
MLTYIVRRLLYSIPVLVATSFIIFVFVSISGDPLAQVRMIPDVDQSSIQSLIEEKHLDDPLVVRYGYWVKDAVTQGFGTRLLSEREIWPDLTRALGNTMQLIIAAELLAVLLAIAIGVYSAVRQYSIFDYTSTAFTFLGFATPIFWLALMLQVAVVALFNATGVRIFYIAQLSSVDPGSGLHFLLDRIQHLAIPVVVLSVLSIAQFSRYMRASMLEVVNSDYVRTARAKGLREGTVVMKHAFRNALIPLTTVIALDFAALFGGAIVTETIFALDGMGLYFIGALQERDTYAIMAWLMVTSVIIIFFNLLADVVYGYLDPRIRYD